MDRCLFHVRELVAFIRRVIRADATFVSPPVKECHRGPVIDRLDGFQCSS
jgi:hypothetical protein